MNVFLDDDDDDEVIVLDESDPKPCLTVSSDSDSSDEEVDSVVNEIVGTNCSVKMNCPMSGLQRHNAVVLDVESLNDNTVMMKINFFCCYR